MRKSSIFFGRIHLHRHSSHARLWVAVTSWVASGSPLARARMFGYGRCSASFARARAGGRCPALVRTPDAGVDPTRDRVSQAESPPCASPRVSRRVLAHTTRHTLSCLGSPPAPRSLLLACSASGGAPRASPGPALGGRCAALGRIPDDGVDPTRGRVSQAESPPCASPRVSRRVLAHTTRHTLSIPAFFVVCLVPRTGDRAPVVATNALPRGIRCQAQFAGLNATPGARLIDVPAREFRHDERP